MWVPSLIALLVAVGLAFAWTASRRPGTAWLAVGWGCYAGYEAAMAARVLCSGECNIRVDLLVIYPALLVWTAVIAIRALLRQRAEQAT